MSSASIINRTRNPQLQEQLTNWDNQLHAIQSLSDLSARQQALDAFVRGFVPIDIEAEDIIYYEGNLLNDEVRFFSKISPDPV